MFENLSEEEMDRVSWSKEFQVGSVVYLYLRTPRGYTAWARNRWTNEVYGCIHVSQADWVRLGTWDSEEGSMGKFIQKAQELAAKTSEKGGAASDPVLAKKIPAVVEFLCEVDDGNGGKRQTSTLLVFTEDGMWKVCLNDRETGQTLWASGASLETALGALDVMLQAPNAPWRAAKPTSGPGKKSR